NDRAQPEPYVTEKLSLRSRSLNRNNSIAVGATNTYCQNIIGCGLRPQSTLRADRLGISEEEAAAIRTQAETVFESFSATADIGNRNTFYDLQTLTFRKIIEDGEVLALMGWADDPWRSIKRVIQLLECDQLAGGGPDAPDGIVLGANGQPVSYRIYNRPQREPYNSLFKDPTDITEIPAQDAQGRPKILHLFRVLRPGQTRGIPLFAPVINAFKDLADYFEAEAVAARVAACVSLVITKNDPYAAQLGATVKDNDESRLQYLEPGLVHYASTGESVSMVDPKRPGTQFEPFVEQSLRMIGVALDLPFELIMKNFSKTNYSSARAALLEARRTFLWWRSWFINRFCLPIWGLVFEEGVRRGYINAPLFDELNYRAEYIRCSYVGPAFGWVDPVKEIEAAGMAVDLGLSTQAEQAAAAGSDWEEILVQRAREQARARELGVIIGTGTKGVTSAVANEPAGAAAGGA
ncbi:MAG: phage portal protein, partial [Deltaproteobacteria bacterium]|nr:phage portal protein [Deltaproteobacteria bacterium]